MATVHISRVDTILAKHLPSIERVLSGFLPDAVVKALIDFLVFGIKQAWACLFGGLLLAGIIATTYFYPTNGYLSRYDFLVIYAVAIQLIFLITKLERPSEALVILIFHIVGTAMEVFKTDAGSWAYPEESLFRIGAVPLFSGFMYAAVGSYLARVSRVFEFRWTGYPPRIWTLILAAAIYINFFAHHYTYDVRYVLFAACGLIFWRTKVHFRVWRWRHQMPLLIGFFLVSLFIWIAENIGTFTKTWLYPGQETGWYLVPIEKLGSWYLLMIISWVLVTLVHRPQDLTAGDSSVDQDHILGAKPET
ncbi:MAG: DUF817 domain-containing protein [Henriciella sp.]|nr:DUF817 domain-containing protein [Henriciella sp.]